KYSGLDFTRNCIFINETSFHINIWLSYKISSAGIHAHVKTKTKKNKELPNQQASKRKRKTKKAVKRAASPLSEV
ncbi:hypothetical protein F4703DRAFT_1731063, partial [Phycomyces blakesleeanus]